MPKPSGNLPIWNTDGASPPDVDQTEPNLAKKQRGWEVDEVPPSGFFNWLQWKYGQWIEYLNGLEGEDLTWTGQHVFSNTGNTFNGSSVIVDEVTAGLAFLERIDMGAGTNPSVSTGVTNEMYKKQIVKCFGRIALNNTATPVVSSGGINIASVTADALEVTVNFTVALIGGNYASVVTMWDPQTSAARHCYVTGQSNGAFTFNLKDGSNNVLDPRAAGQSGINICFSVHGPQ